jgi:hypothetical protein
MVNPGNSAHRYQARPKADQASKHHRMVTLAKSSPGRRSARAPQSKTATVMLGWQPPRARPAASAKAAAGQTETKLSVDEGSWTHYSGLGMAVKAGATAILTSATPIVTNFFSQP